MIMQETLPFDCLPISTTQVPFGASDWRMAAPASAILARPKLGLIRSTHPGVNHSGELKSCTQLVDHWRTSAKLASYGDGILRCTQVIQMAPQNSMYLVTQAGRRNVMYEDSDTYVLIEPDQDERFVTLQELRMRLKGWLEKWPGTEIPTDLDKFTDIEEAVAYLIESVCELEIGGGLGSIQWYKVRLEAT